VSHLSGHLQLSVPSLCSDCYVLKRLDHAISGFKRFRVLRQWVASLLFLECYDFCEVLAPLGQHSIALMTLNHLTPSISIVLIIIKGRVFIFSQE